MCINPVEFCTTEKHFDAEEKQTEREVSPNVFFDLNLENDSTSETLSVINQQPRSGLTLERICSMHVNALKYQDVGERHLFHIGLRDAKTQMLLEETTDILHWLQYFCLENIEA